MLTNSRSIRISRVVTTLAGCLLSFPSLAAQSVNAERQEAAAIAAVEGMVQVIPAVALGRAALCLAAFTPQGAREVSTTLLRAVQDSLRQTPVRVSTLRDCPRTYASMILRVDSQGQPIDARPKGTLDPVYLVIEPAVTTASGALLVRIQLNSGSGTRFYVCEIRDCSAHGPAIVH
jgi:hypothetical protein